jgi:hypothetical protein
MTNCTAAILKAFANSGFMFNALKCLRESLWDNTKNVSEMISLLGSAESDLKDYHDESDFCKKLKEVLENQQGKGDISLEWFIFQILYITGWSRMPKIHARSFSSSGQSSHSIAYEDSNEFAKIKIPMEGAYNLVDRIVGKILG